jgi:hypothetical protein
MRLIGGEVAGKMMWKSSVNFPFPFAEQSISPVSLVLLFSQLYCYCDKVCTPLSKDDQFSHLYAAIVEDTHSPKL